MKLVYANVSRETLILYFYIVVPIALFHVKQFRMKKR